MPFSGLKVLVLESRRAAEMEVLVRRHGGEPFVAPSLKERPLEANTEILGWAERLFAGDFDMTILLTGTGLSYLRDAVLTRYPAGQFVEGLRATTLVARGPKPAAVLRELGLKAQINVPEPNTWRELVIALADRPERRITLQEYGRPNPELIAALQANGSRVTPVSIYRWEMPDDPEPLREAVRRIAHRACDVVLFTTSVQVVHLLRMAEAMGLDKEVLEALGRDLVIASIGPVTDAALAERGLAPDVVPAHPKMAALVRAAAEQSAAALGAKRSRARRV